MKTHTKTLLASLTASATIAGSATAATYTLTGASDPTDLTVAGNWTGGSILPNAEVNADLVVSGAANYGGTTGLAGVRTVGSISNTSGGTVRIDQVGNWNTNSQTGWVFDTGSAANATIDAVGTLHLYYAPMTLTSDVEITSGKFKWRSYGSRYGIQGAGGFIINSGTEMEVDGTHGSDTFDYTGGVTVLSGGIVDLNAENGSLGTGLLTIHEGGHMQAAGNSFQNDALLILTTDGDGAQQFITGGNGGWGAGGEWTFDLSGADQTVGNTWQIANASGDISLTYDNDGLDGDDFSVTGATRDGSGVWSGTSGTALFSYTESTGVLEITGVVPEPGSLALLGFGGLLIAARRRRG